MDLWHLTDMKVVLTLQILNFAQSCAPFSCIDFFAFDEIKWLCAFFKHTTQKSITKSHELILPTSVSCSWYCLHTSIDSIWYQMQKTLGNVFLRYQGGLLFHVFPRFHSIMSWGYPPARYILEFLWMFQYSIQAMQHLRWSSLWQNS